MPNCKSIGCTHQVLPGQDFCTDCTQKPMFSDAFMQRPQSLSEKYPQYYKPVGNLEEVDVYAVHHLFNIQDPSGCIQHASKKLLLSGVRIGGKSKAKDIREARDTLDRWLQLNPETSV